MNLFRKPLVKKPHPMGNGGIQRLYRFPNGYGASVVRFKTSWGGYGSYTSNESEWELAVIKWDSNKEDDFHLIYDTPITNDVIGHLKSKVDACGRPSVEYYLQKIKDLPTEYVPSSKVY